MRCSSRRCPCPCPSLLTTPQVFSELIDISVRIGHSDNEQRELESKAEVLRQRAHDRNMAKIRQDIQQVQAENAALAAKLAAL
jgi:hypothetical protein